MKYVNANGGVAGRTLKIDFIDSHLNPNDTRNAIITACGQDLAMVGTATALFTGLDDLTGCKDQAGQATGLPDIGSIVLGTPQACAPIVVPGDPVDDRLLDGRQEPADVPDQPGRLQVPGEAAQGDLNGPFIKSSDSPDAARSTDSLADGGQERRHRRHQHAVAVELVDRRARSPRRHQDEAGRLQLVRQRPHHARCGAASARRPRCRASTDSVVWQCTSACYDQKAMAAAGDAMNGEYVDLGFLPFSEAKSNKTLAGYLKYIGKDNANAFGVYGFEAVLAFKEAAEHRGQVDRRAHAGVAAHRAEGHPQLQRRRHDGHGEHRRQGAVELLHGRAVEERQVQPDLPEEGRHVRLHRVEPLHVPDRPHDPVKSGLLGRRKVNGVGHPAVSVMVSAWRAMRAGRSAGCQPVDQVLAVRVEHGLTQLVEQLQAVGDAAVEARRVAGGEHEHRLRHGGERLEVRLVDPAPGDQ